MGLIKETKKSSNDIGLEIIYGGKEAPFGGIDVSAPDRYIDPKCFVDASNFLLVDNELCICSFSSGVINPPPAVSYPIAYPTSVASILLGVGKLPCERFTKTWALYGASEPDSNNFINYTLVISTSEDVGSTQTFNFALPAQTITLPAQNATASIIIGYGPGLTAIQSVTSYPINPGPTTPSTYDNKYYDYDVISISINGAGGSYPVVLPFAPLLQFGNTPASGPVTVPTPATLATQLASNINSGGYPFTAAVSGSNPNEVILTAIPAGTLGNAIILGAAAYTINFCYFPPTSGQSIVVEANPSLGGNNYPPFTQSSFNFAINQFTGGQNAGSVAYSSSPIQLLTYETIGDNLYIAGFPAGYMLQFNNSTSSFNVLTQFQGARVLAKFTDHLISVGLINSATQFETEAHLWLNWSAPGDPAQWDSNDSSGNITGAGGGQLDDISDTLTGLVITNSTAFILHTDGLSYATPLSSGEDPFDINHVSLAKDGQGCPSTSLFCQFDQIGFYVGQSNTFLLGQSPQAVGTKIEAILRPALLEVGAIGQTGPDGFFQDFLYQKVNVAPLMCPINNRQVIQYAVNVQGVIFVYDAGADTWMKLDVTEQIVPPFINPLNGGYQILRMVPLPIAGVLGFLGSVQPKATFLYAQNASKTNGNITQLMAPNTWQLVNKVSTLQSSHITFPAEEIAVGRDITINGLYVVVAGIPGLSVQFTISGWQSGQDGNPSAYATPFNGQITLDANADPDTPQEYQVFDIATGGPITLKAPQIEMIVPPQSGSVGSNYSDTNPDFKLIKLVAYGNYDPTQMPIG